MLKINGKTFMNIQQAVQWLLDNNALPFQSTANYVANAEIGMGTIVNPSPAKVRIGSLIFFADSKVSTVTGLTENGFIVSAQYNDLVDDVVYVSNVAINASGHLICTLSNGDTIDAGLIKQVTGFSIDDSQHLIVAYNDGSTADLGAIFSGNVNIAGNLTADSIIENMSGYSLNTTVTEMTDLDVIYAGAVKNGNKLTFVLFASFQKSSATGVRTIARFNIPLAVANKLYPTEIITGYNTLDLKTIDCVDSGGNVVPSQLSVFKPNTTSIDFNLKVNDLTLGTTYFARAEVTFLLSENLAS